MDIIERNLYSLIMLSTILSEQLNLPTVAQKSLFGRSALSDENERDAQQH